MKKNKFILLIITVMAISLSLPVYSSMVNIKSMEKESEAWREEGFFVVDALGWLLHKIQGPKGIFFHIEKNNMIGIKLFIKNSIKEERSWKINLTNSINRRYINEEPYHDFLDEQYVELTPLLFAINIGAEEEGLLLLSERAIDINKPDNFKSTPLHKACFHKRFMIAIKLLEKGAFVNSKDCMGNSPLLCCLIGIKDPKTSFNDYVDVLKIIRLLVSSKAIIDDKAIEHSRELVDKYPEILKYLTLIKEYNDIDSEDKIKRIDTSGIEREELRQLFQYVLYRSIIKIEANHNHEILKFRKCGSFTSTSFYKIFKTSKNKKNIARIFSLQDIENLYEFVIKAAENNNFYFDKKLWTKFDRGSKMLNNKKYSDCKIFCEN